MKELKNSQNVYVGKKIREMRKERRITQLELGERIGVRGNTVSAYERGIIEVPHSKLLEIARVLGVKYTELLPIEGDTLQESMSERIETAKKDLTEDQGAFLENLIGKTLSLEESERESFLENIRFAVEYFERKK